MTRIALTFLLGSMLVLPLAGCASMSDFTIDPTEWFSGDWFGNKKKLPGERKPVFPEGVPGVTRGIPSDLVKGNQETADIGVNPQNVGAAEPGAAAEDEKSKPKAKAKPKPKVAAKPAPAEEDSKPTPITVRRAPASSEQQQQPAAGQWPEPPPPAPQRQNPGGTQWPDPPSGRATQPSGVQWPDPPPVR